MAQGTEAIGEAQTQQTIEMYLVRTGVDEVEVQFDDPTCGWAVTAKWLASVLDRGTTHNIVDLIRATTVDHPVGSVTATIDGAVDDVAYNLRSIRTWEKYNQVESKRAETGDLGTPEPAKESQKTEVEYPDDEETDDEPEEEKSMNAVYEFDVRLTKSVRTFAGGTVDFGVKLIEMVVSADIACPKLAHKSDESLSSTHSKKQGMTRCKF